MPAPRITTQATLRGGGRARTPLPPDLRRHLPLFAGISLLLHAVLVWVLMPHAAVLHPVLPDEPAMVEVEMVDQAASRKGESAAPDTAPPPSPETPQPMPDATQAPPPPSPPTQTPDPAATAAPPPPPSPLATPTEEPAEVPPQPPSPPAPDPTPAPPQPQPPPQPAAPAATPAQTPPAEAAPPPAPSRPQAAPGPANRPSTVNIDGSDDDRDPLSVTGENVVPPRPDAQIHNRPPLYPVDAARRRAQGTVTLLIHVTEAGIPAWIDVIESSGDASLDQAARNAVALWHFAPARNGGQPVPFDLQYRINFSLGRH